MKYLIVVDMQNDFVYGSLGTEEARAIVPSIESKIRQYSESVNTRILFTKDTHLADNYSETQEGQKLPVAHCYLGSDGWEIIPEIKKYCRESNTINKFSFGYYDWEHEFPNPRWGKNKDGVIDTFEIIGVCTDICVISNAMILKSLYPEIPIIVDASCCAGTTPENHRAALQVMKSCQIDIINE